MHDLAPLIKDLTIILGVASLVTLIFQKIRQPVVLGYLVAGTIIGPYTPPHALVSDIPNIKILSELGVIFLMFSLGLDFSFHKLKRVGFAAGITGLFEVVIMLLLGLAVGLLIGLSFYSSLFLGAAIAISSTTIIIKALAELKLKSKHFAEIIFGILVVEDLLAILLLAGLTTMATSTQAVTTEIIIAAIKLILVVGGWFLLGYFLVPPLFRRIMHYTSEETLLIVSVSLCLILVCTAAYFHYSTALGAFIMGSILAETSLVHRIEQLIRPIRDIFAAVFFVSIGMLIDPKVIYEHLAIVLLLCGITILGKMLITGIGSFLTGQSINTSIRIGFSMAQIGEFSFIIIALGLALNITDNSLYSIIVAVSAVTTFTTPYFIQLSGYLDKTLNKRLSEQTKYFLASYSTWIHRISATSNQQSIYLKALLRLIINGVLVAIIFTIIQRWVLPDIITIFNRMWLAKIVCWISTLIISSSFIWGMLSAFRFTAANHKIAISNANPALYLSWLFTIIEISILSIAYFDTWIINISVSLSAIIFFSLLYKQLDKTYHWFEQQLVRNLSSNISNHTRYQELAPWDNHLVEIEINQYSPLIGQTLAEHKLRQQFDINIVAIYRGKSVILAPNGQQQIMPLDKLIVLGNDDQIERFCQQYIKEAPIVEHTDLLENFELRTLLVEENSNLIGKSIRNSGILERTKGLVVGIEQQNDRILNPSTQTILQADDLLFIAGEKQYLENL